MAKGIEAARDIMETTGNENLVSVCLTFLRIDRSIFTSYKTKIASLIHWFSIGKLNESVKFETS